MLQLRREQIDALHQAARKDLIRRICSYLTIEMPEWTSEYSERDLRLFISDCMEVCDLIPIESDQGIAKYCCIALDAEVTWGLDEDMYWYLSSVDEPESRLDLLIDTILYL